MSAGVAPYAIDPFGPSANPGAYVAFEASERARAALERALDAGRIAAVIGPPGHGKTLLLRLLGGREEERARVAYVPFATLEPDEFYTLVLSVLGVPSDASPRDALLDLAGALAKRGGVVILIDDAGGMSDACAASLADLYRAARGTLRLAFAAVEGADATRVLRAFGAAVDVIHLGEGMSEREVRRYVEMRLAYGGARPELVAAFDEETIEALHRASQGVPRRLNQAAEDVVRRAARIALPRLREIAGLEEPVPATRDVAPPPAHAANVHDAPVETGAGVEAPSSETGAGVEAPSSETGAGVEAPSVPHLPPVVTPPEAPVVAPPPGAPVTPVPPPSRLSAVPDPPPLPPEPELPRSAWPAAPTPAPRSDEEDARGILLQDAFDDGPGEYRLVRGRFVDSERGEPVVPERASDAWDASRDRRAGAGAEVRDVQWLRRRTDAARREARAASVPAAAPQRAPRELPIRALGFAGFAIGIAGSLYWMSLSSEPGLPALPELPTLFDAESPGVEAPIATEAPEPTVAPAAPEPAPAPEASVAPVPKPIPPPAVAPAPKPATPAPAAAPPVAVSINATPWAVIEVDGRELGETPLAGVPLAPGVHLFRARMPDGTTRERAIEIAPDNDTVVFQ